MFFEIVFALFVLLVTICCLILFKFERQARKVKILLFPLTKTIYYLLNRTRFVDRIYNFWVQNKYPDFYAIWLGGRLTFLASSPDSAQWLLSLREESLVKDASNTLSSIKILFDENVLISNGEAWRRQRQIYNPAFSKPSYQNYFTYFSSTVDKGLAFLQEKTKHGEDFDFILFLSHFTLDVLGLSIFGHDFKSIEGKLEDYYVAYKTVFSFDSMRMIMAFFPWLDNGFNPYSRKLRSAVVKLNELFNKLIEERSKNPKDDMLTHLLEASRAHSGVTLSEQELRGNLFILFLAGHETTATALSWTMLELAQHPEIQKKIRKEIETVLGDKSSPTIEELENLKYLDNVIKESLRRHPPVPFLPARRCLQDLKYKDVDIPKGTIVGISINNIHHHPQFWEEPFQFNPDRWNDDKLAHRYSYLPFSLGPRMCVGNNFSLIEQRIFLFKLIKEFDIGMPLKHKFSMERGPGINTPKNVWVTLVEAGEQHS